MGAFYLIIGKRIRNRFQIGLQSPTFDTGKQRMKLRFSSLLLVAGSLVGALACSAGGSSPPSRVNSEAGSGSTIDPTGGGGTPGIITTGGGDTNPADDPNDKRNVPVRQKTCDASGTNCTCLRLAMLGTLASAAKDSDAQAFTDWLNQHAGGTATLTNVPTKPTIDATFLANYDILLVANVNTWTLSSDEKAAVEKWATDTGGGIITLTGFDSMAEEPPASSQIISFAGLGYGNPITAPNDTMQAQNTPIYYKGGTTNLRSCMFWNGSDSGTHSSPFITAAVPFTAQTDVELSKLTLNLSYVGAFYGWTVTAPSTATILAKDPVTQSPIAAALEYNGKGRILAFGDEWVIFTNEWTHTGTPSNMQMDSGNPCWVPANGTTAGFFHSVESLYQTKQFWFNVINWVAPPNACNFTITDTGVVVK